MDEHFLLLLSFSNHGFLVSPEDFLVSQVSCAVALQKAIFSNVLPPLRAAYKAWPSVDQEMKEIM